MVKSRFSALVLALGTSLEFLLNLGLTLGPYRSALIAAPRLKLRPGAAIEEKKSHFSIAAFFYCGTAVDDPIVTSFLSIAAVIKRRIF